LIWGFLTECWLLVVTPLASHPAAPQLTQASRASLPATDLLKYLAATIDIRGLAVGMLSLMFFSVITCAAYRAIVRPADRSFAYLRIGPIEAMLSLSVLAWIGWPFILPILGGLVVVTGIGAELRTASTGGTPMMWISLLVGFVTVFLGPVISLWLVLRISLLGPMSVDRGRVPFSDAWRLSQGRVWALFALSIGVWAIEAIWLFLGNLPIGRLGLSWTPALTPGFLGAFAVGGVCAGVGSAMGAAPWARAYRNLIGEDPSSAFE